MANTRVKVVAEGFTAWLVLDEAGRCTAADAELRQCVGRERGELRGYFARQGWVATVLVAKATAAPDPPGAAVDTVRDDPMVRAILAAFPGAVVRPLSDGEWVPVR